MKQEISEYLLGVLKNFIVKTSKELFGEDVQFTFEYVTEIPKLHSGKSGMTVCLIPEKGQ